MPGEDTGQSPDHHLSARLQLEHVPLQSSAALQLQQRSHWSVMASLLLMHLNGVQDFCLNVPTALAFNLDLQPAHAFGLHWL